MPEPASQGSVHIVPPGQELAVAQALAGEIINLKPVCPLCGHVGACRVDESMLDGERGEAACHLTWCAAHGVTAAVTEYADMPRLKGGRRYVGVRCDECRYVSTPSAFCRPTGPPHVA